MVDANCWLEWKLTPQKLIHSYRFESCPDYKWLVTVNGFTVGRYVDRNILNGFKTHTNLKNIVARLKVESYI